MPFFWAAWATACFGGCLPARLTYMSSLVKTCCLALMKGPSFPCTGDRMSGSCAEDRYSA